MIPAAVAGHVPTRIAYFSMEIALESGIPTYSGGLGVLAGDTLRAAADRALEMVGVTLVYRKGYFKQRLDETGNQTEEPSEWSPEGRLPLETSRARVRIEGREVLIRAWRYSVTGVRGHIVPVFLLDTALEENSPWDRTITDHLYGGDGRYRLAQEIVLGLGGVAVLRELGYSGFGSYHMNEGHSALLALALMAEEARRTEGKVRAGALDSVRSRCVFTTHTPIAAGHDRFPEDLARGMLGPDIVELLDLNASWSEGALNMTRLGLSCSRYVNGVSMRHGEVSRSLFPGHPIDAVTNGVHAVTWASEPLRQLFDRHIPEWRRDNLYLRYANGIPLHDVSEAHQGAKKDLLAEVEARTGQQLDPEVFTIGFARRATSYKRPDLLFTDLERLRQIATRTGRIQILYAGKAHPRDVEGKDLIKKIVSASGALKGSLAVAYLEGYDMALGLKLCAGSDLWLNTPLKPLEASGTSGMKAAVNGVPSLSVLDGWWIEGHVEGVTGWSIGDGHEAEVDPAGEVESLYAKLEDTIVPLFYSAPLAFTGIRRSTIALNGSWFNAQRMLSQYIMNAYSGPR